MVGGRAVLKDVVIFAFPDIHAEADGFAVDGAGGEEHALSAVRAAAEGEFIPHAAPRDGHFQLELALLRFVFDGDPLGQRALRIDGVDVLRLGLRLRVFGLALMFLPHLDIRSSRGIRIGLEVEFVFGFFAVRFGLVISFYGILRVFVEEQHACDGVVLFALLLVRLAAQKFFVVIQGVGDSVPEQVRVEDVHAESVPFAARDALAHDAAVA